MQISLQEFFEMMMFRNSIRNVTEFYCQSAKIPPDDILEGLYKLRIRESEKLKTVLELYDLEIHQRTAGFDHHRLKTKVHNKYRAGSTKKEILKPETEILRETPWSRIRGQNSVNKEV